MGKGIIKVTHELFEDFFDFPKGTKIIGIRENLSTRTMDFLVDSPRLPDTPEGFEAPVIEIVGYNKEKAYDIFVSENIRVTKKQRFELQL